VIDAVDMAGGGEPAQLLNGNARAEADLEDTVSWLHVEQRDDLQVALPVRGAMGHDPADDVTNKAARSPELTDKARTVVAAG
jgi:hypothetical protein